MVLFLLWIALLGATQVNASPMLIGMLFFFSRFIPFRPSLYFDCEVGRNEQSHLDVLLEIERMMFFRNNYQGANISADTQCIAEDEHGVYNHNVPQLYADFYNKSHSIEFHFPPGKPVAYKGPTQYNLSNTTRIYCTNETYQNCTFVTGELSRICACGPHGCTMDNCHVIETCDGFMNCNISVAHNYQ